MLSMPIPLPGGLKAEAWKLLVNGTLSLGWEILVESQGTPKIRNSPLIVPLGPATHTPQ